MKMKLLTLFFVILASVSARAQFVQVQVPFVGFHKPNDPVNSTYCVYAISTDGTLKSYGHRSQSYSNCAIPTDLGKVSSISTGAASTCVMMAAGGTRCWGYFQTMNFSDANAVQVSISVGNHQSGCLTTKDAKVKCWSGPYTGGYIVSMLPKDLRNVAKVATGEDFACALIKDGTTQCWGNGIAHISATGVLDLASNRDAMCFMYNESIVCKSGALVDPYSIDLNSLGRVAPDEKFVSLSTGRSHACGLTNHSRILCKENPNAYMKVDNSVFDTPIDLGEVLSMSTSFDRTCAVTKSLGIRCWGAPIDLSVDYK